jgi:hypothetical protein
MSAPGYIPDGHTLQVWINEAACLYPRITFSFRRMTSADFADYLDTIATWKEKQAQRLISAYLKARIVNWDYKDTKGEAAPLTEEIMQGLPRKLSQRLWFVVAGIEGPDGIAGQDRSDADAEFHAALEAARTDRHMMPVLEEAQRKN